MNRYERQTALIEIGEEGQQKILKAKVLIVGIGGLGSPLSLYLAAAGVGTIGVMDEDKVSLTNLQRQILYNEQQLGEEKAMLAKKRLEELNSDITIHTYPFLNEENAETIISQYDIVADACDNFATRYLINRTCRKLGKPYVYGAIQGFVGQVSVFGIGTSPLWYTDLFPEPEPGTEPPTTSKAVMGVTPGVIGCVEANEVLKLIVGYGNLLNRKLWTIDLRSMQTQIIQL